MPTVEKILEEMRHNPRNVRFRDLLKVAEHFFGEPRIHGSHYVFHNVWSDDPRIVLQRDGASAKPYQVKQVLKAIDDFMFLKGDDHE